VPKIHDNDDVDITSCPVCGDTLRVSAASWHVDTCLLRSDILKRKRPQGTTARQNSFRQTDIAQLPRRNHTLAVTQLPLPRPSLIFPIPPPPARLPIALCGENWRLPTTFQDGFETPVHRTLKSSNCNTVGYDMPHHSSVNELERIVVPLRGREKRGSKVAPVPESGTVVVVTREENEADPRAIVCTVSSSGDDTDKSFLGYVPRQVSAHLSPVLDAGLITVSATVFCSQREQLVETGKAGGRLASEIAVELSLEEYGAESYDQIASAWCAASDAAKDVRVGLREVLRQRFWTAFDRVQSDLLTSTEIAMLSTLRRCSAPAQALTFRLLQRKSGWFRVPMLKYDEVENVKEACAELVTCGVALSGENPKVLEECADVEDRLRALSREELTNFARSFDILGHHGSRKQLTAAIISDVGSRTEKFLHAWCMVYHDRPAIIRLNPVLWHAFKVVLFLTFLRPCDLNALIMEDIGVTRYPLAVALSTAAGTAEEQKKKNDLLGRGVNGVFSTRESLDEYLNLVERAAEVDAAYDGGDDAVALELLATILNPFLDGEKSSLPAARTCFLRRFEPAWVRARMATLGATLLERNGRYAEATKIYFSLLSAPHYPEKRGVWYVRACTNLSRHLSRGNDAVLVCEAGLKDPWVRSGERLGLQRRALRLARQFKRWGLLGARWRLDVEWEAPIDMIRATALNANAPDKNRYCTILDNGDATVSVECLAMEHYADTENWRGVHSETRVWTTLFVLLFADVILLPIPGVFQSQFQIAPLDFGTDSFVAKRLPAIADRLALIRKGDGKGIVRTMWHKFYGCAIQGVSWILLSLVDLCDIVDGLGGTSLADIMGLLAEDFSSWSSGAPDLLLWQRRANSAIYVKAVEVKSANDRLSDQQRAWLLALRDAGVSVAVCRVDKHPGT
jgi:Fanconi-associated nuclease 1